MRVFVLSTGRCGSTTFTRACEHFTNYTSGHEIRARKVGPVRLSYPDHHIENDNRLTWFLGRLDRAFGNSAFYVHLTRDVDAVAHSFAKRMSWEGAILPAYANGIIMNGTKVNPNAENLDFAYDYIDTVTSNIEHFLKDKTMKMNFSLEEAESDFPAFCEKIAANGDLDAATAEFKINHNASR